MLSMGTLLTFLGIGLAVALPGFGSSQGVGLVGKAGTGVIAEDPEKFTPILILDVLPATQGIYGLLIGLMIMIKIGVFGGNLVTNLDLNTGLALLFSTVPIALVGWVSAIFQGRVAAAGVSVVAKRPEELVKTILLAAMVETYAVLALLASLLMVMAVQI